MTDDQFLHSFHIAPIADKPCDHDHCTGCDCACHTPHSADEFGTLIYEQQRKIIDDASERISHLTEHLILYQRGFWLLAAVIIIRIIVILGYLPPILMMQWVS